MKRTETIHAQLALDWANGASIPEVLERYELYLADLVLKDLELQGGHDTGAYELGMMRARHLILHGVWYEGE